MALTLECRKLEVFDHESVMLPAISFTFTEPSLVALTGPNGAGKTTLLRTLAGRQLPTAGECLIDSRTPDEFDPTFRAKVASLIDTPPMARDMTLAEQLALVRVSWGADQHAAFAEAEKLLSRLTIAQLGQRFPFELSAGQLQLFAVALTLSRPFELLLLDEPERHLDDQRVQVLLGLIEERIQAGAVVLTATHRAEITKQTAHYIHLGKPEGS